MDILWLKDKHVCISETNRLFSCLFFLRLLWGLYQNMINIKCSSNGDILKVLFQNFDVNLSVNAVITAPLISVILAAPKALFYWRILAEWELQLGNG